MSNRPKLARPQVPPEVAALAKQACPDCGERGKPRYSRANRSWNVVVNHYDSCPRGPAHGGTPEALHREHERAVGKVSEATGTPWAYVRRTPTAGYMAGAAAVSEHG